MTKGDLDIQIVVDRGGHAVSRKALARRYESNPGAFASEGPCSFKDDGERPPLGVHLIVAGSPDDFQWRFREVLLARADLRRDYDALKRSVEGKSMEAYRAAKEVFFAGVKATPEFRATRGAQRRSRSRIVGMTPPTGAAAVRPLTNQGIRLYFIQGHAGAR